MIARETPRESFNRNHQENIRTMRAALLRAEREGRLHDAERIRRLARAWEDAAA